jgi:hypothetical protein
MFPLQGRQSGVQTTESRSARLHYVSILQDKSHCHGFHCTDRHTLMLISMSSLGV